MRTARCFVYRIPRPLALIALVAATGCGTRQTPEEAFAKQMKEYGLPTSTVFPLGGKVTIDGKPPAAGEGKVFVILTDPSNPEQPPRERPYAEVDPDGTFRFSTQQDRDGVKPGNYVVAFLRLRDSRKEGHLGPDKLLNLYNDPDSQAQHPEFKIEHKSPGKSDYAFDLQVAGREAARPGPHTISDVN